MSYRFFSIIHNQWLTVTVKEIIYRASNENQKDVLYLVTYSGREGLVWRSSMQPVTENESTIPLPIDSIDY
jgi:hypothetical protein